MERVPLPDLDCEVTDCIPEVLAAEWKQLETWSDPSVFLSWQWIGVWYSVFRPRVKVLRVRDRGRVVGLGLVSEHSERRHGALVSHCLYLHQTGQASEDQIWIEYNGFLAGRGYESAVAQSCVGFLKRTLKKWDEFVIGAVEKNYALDLAKSAELTAHIRWEAPSFGIDLSHFRRHSCNYMDSLSRNTRHQIRRTRRLYERIGAVYLERPKSIEEAQRLWRSIAPYHIKKWGDEEGESGFVNPDFIQFHLHYIRTNWEEGGADLIVLKVKGEVLAIFYNFIYQKKIYFYLAGVRPETDNRLKPGLLGHQLCIADYLSRGFDYYDLMGGDERYKHQLAQCKNHLVQVSLQRARFKLKAEQVARKIKNRWLVA